LFNISKAAQGIYLCVLQGVNIEAVFGRCGIFFNINHAQNKSLLSNKQGGLKLIFTVLLILTTEPLLHTIKALPKLVLIPT